MNRDKVVLSNISNGIAWHVDPPLESADNVWIELDSQWASFACIKHPPCSARFFLPSPILPVLMQVIRVPVTVRTTQDYFSSTKIFGNGYGCVRCLAAGTGLLISL